MLITVSFAWSQSVGGHWRGMLILHGGRDTFRYELYLEQEGDAVSGISISTAPDGRSARFSVSGLMQDRQLKLQEVEQLEPETPYWCRKFSVLELERSAYRWQLRGPWQADRCPGGAVQLQLVSFTGMEQEPQPFSMAGVWKGVLKQSDRDYGFYFELQLKEGSKGSSYIVSEGNGGWARHVLNWSWNAKDSLLQFEEAAVSQKSDTAWPWCIKKGRLRLRHSPGKYLLEGPWEGYIEGHEPSAGACAPGTLALEKPVLPPAVLQEMDREAAAYAALTRRTVDVQRILDVRSETIRVKVWDNGISDGDVLTLYLNGQQVLEQYRVTKQRYAIPVKLKRGENMLVLHAIDLGRIKPNTVAVAVDDGFREQTIILSSNLDESGGVLIRFFEFR